jgi:hypothetical protein
MKKALAKEGFYYKQAIEKRLRMKDFPRYHQFLYF